MTEYRAQAIILKKLLHERNNEIEELRKMNQSIGKRILESFGEALRVVYSPPADNILQEVYAQCSAITGNPLAGEISSLDVIRALQGVARLKPDLRMISIIEKMTFCLEYNFMNTGNSNFVLKKLELLAFG
jgi:hypothetical protein